MKNKTSVGIIGIFVIIVVFLAGSHILYRPQYYSQKYVELTDSWSIRGVVEEDNVNLRDLALPQMCQGDQIIFTTVLPEISIDNPMLRFYTVHAAVRVYLDRELVYEYGHERLDKGKMIGYGYQLADIPQNYEGKELMIVFDVSENNAFTSINVPVLCNSVDAIKSIAIEVRFPLAVNMFLFIFGLSIIAASFLLLFHNHGFRKLICIGLFSVGVAIWSFCNYDAIFLFTNNPITKAYLEFSSLYLAPIPFVYYFYDNVRSRKSIVLRFAYYTILTAQLIFTTIALLLHAFDIAHMPQVLYVEHILLMAMIIFMVVLSIYDLSKRQMDHVVLFIGMAIMLLTGLFDIVHFNLQKFVPTFYDEHYQSVLYIGTLAFVFSQILDFVNELSNSMRELVKTETLEKMAYTDYLTGIANRRRCEEEMERLDTEQDNYGIFSFDLNNLKSTNDTLGHGAGDEMIRKFADILKDTFKESALVGRMGGDEFIAIISKADYVDINHYVLELDRKIKLEMRQEHSYDLSTAYGYCEKREFKDLDVKGIYRKADARMYDMKIEMKFKKESAYYNKK